MKRFFIPTLLNNPRAVFADFDNFYRAFENSASSRTNGDSRSILPDYRVHEDEGVYNIELDLPGISDKDIDISVKENILTITATRKREAKNENSENGEAVENIVAKYERSFTIGDKIDTDNIAAICRDGMLMLSLPISEEKASIKKIEVNKHLENSENK